MGFNSGFKGLRKMRWPGHRARMGEQRVIEDFGREIYVNETSWKS